MKRKILFSFLAFFTFNSLGFAQFIDTGENRVRTYMDVPFKRIGTIKPKHVSEIEKSNWTIGCEVLDRDYTNFDSYKTYLPVLGIKKIRLQGGWAKTEKQRGVYDWAWLDHIIDYARANGLKPWLQTSYSNPVYNSGGKDLGGGIPTTEEALQGWDRWVEAMVTRYKNKVTEWEMWNEPDGNKSNTPELVADFNIRTAEIIKRVQPEAEIAGLAMASGSNVNYLDRYLKVLSDRGKLDLFKWIVYHGYTMNPDDNYKGQAKLDSVLRKYSSVLKLRQGENGAPSAYCPGFALSKYNWTEISQAKWDARRMLGDLGRDVESSVFCIIDMYYLSNNILNVKGLIQSDKTLKALRPKIAFYTVQNIVSVFDNKLKRIPDFDYTTNSKESISVFGYQGKTSGKQLVTLWLDGAIPNNTFETQTIELKIPKGNFEKPVWIDLFSGRMYEIPKSHWSQSGDAYRFTIPVYDSPVLIADLSLIKH
jgi:hypothetical protein